MCFSVQMLTFTLCKVLLETAISRFSTVFLCVSCAGGGGGGGGLRACVCLFQETRTLHISPKSATAYSSVVVLVDSAEQTSSLDHRIPNVCVCDLTHDGR